MVTETLTLEQELDLLAAMEPYEYEKIRKAKAKELDFRPAVLDAEYKERRAKLYPEERAASASGGEAVVCENAEPWDTKVLGSLVLNEIADFVRRFVIFQRPEDADTFALWCFSTYCVDHFDILAYLGITAPDSECGKSTLLEILMQFVSRCLPASSASGPVIYRAIQLYRPTLVLDEMDTIGDDANKELLKVFNAGHKRSLAFVLRCAGDESSTPEKFVCFGPKAYGMIGKPRTMMSRSIIINLLRKSPTERVEKFNLHHLPEGTAETLLRIKRQMVRWAADNAEELKHHVPNMDAIGNRAEDNWSPLFTIAELCGQGWPERAAKAANLKPVHQKVTDSALLLQDMANIFYTRKLQYEQYNKEKKSKHPAISMTLNWGLFLLMCFWQTCLGNMKALGAGTATIRIKNRSLTLRILRTFWRSTKSIRSNIGSDGRSYMSSCMPGRVVCRMSQNSYAGTPWPAFCLCSTAFWRARS